MLECSFMRERVAPRKGPRGRIERVRRSMVAPALLALTVGVGAGASGSCKDPDAPAADPARQF